MKEKIEAEKQAEAKKKTFAEELAKKKQQAIEDKSGLKIYIEKEGTGRKPKPGEIVQVHYTGYLSDGTKFDSSVDRGKAFVFPVGKGKVIAGWDKGILSLKEGTKAILFIPPYLGYGEKGAVALSHREC